MTRMISGLATACIYAVAMSSAIAADNHSYVSGMLTFIDEVEEFD